MRLKLHGNPPPPFLWYIALTFFLTIKEREGACVMPGY